MKITKIVKVFSALALALALVPGVFAAVKVGEAFPDLTGFKLEGSLPAELKGKVVIVDFWASWCGPCQESFPVMNALQKKYGPQGLVIIAVNMDENVSDKDDFLKEHKADFTVVRDAKQLLAEKVEVATMPSSFVIDKEGKVRFAHKGFHGAETQKAYEQQIESLLK